MVDVLISVLLAAVVFCAEGASDCSKKAKAETYLETASELIDKLKDNFPEGGDADCKCPQKPTDCSELLDCGFNTSGIYKIWPMNRITSGSIDVYCDMHTQDGGWTVIQRRGNYRRQPDFFYKNWQLYKAGFGDLRRDFWIGNDNIYALTNQKKYYLRIDLADFKNQTRYAFYDQFWIDNEKHNYRLHIYDYSGDAGDSFSRKHNNQMFSTEERDNDNSTKNCAAMLKAGWWFADCQDSNLNGLYPSSKQAHSDDFLTWTTWRESLQKAEMKIRPLDFRTNLLDMDVEPK